MSSDLVGLKRILENSNDNIIKVCTTLINILSKIISKPNETENRRIRLDSSDVIENLMPFSGGLEVLFEIGFQEESESFFLPFDIGIEKISGLKSKLEMLLNEKKNPPNPKINHPILNPISPLQRENVSSFEHVLMYEDITLKQKALNTMPVERFRSDAQDKLNAYLRLNLDTKPFDISDFLLLELLHWFKNEFFKWINQPDCDYCHSNQKMEFLHSDRALGSEAVWLAGNVEVYKCQVCQKNTRFPRFNHPGKLLETRGGRCGEWANCFCLCLRALEFDARYILDWTDHVWAEVYSNSQKRWQHADPCENILDKPLIYEHGWGKKLSYVIAFSRHEVVDVTWRYSSKHSEIMERRYECDEIWLAKHTSELSKRRQRSLTKAQVESLQLRMVTEVVEFLTPKQVKDGEDIGRQSGSLQWRLSRGEIQLPAMKAGYSFKIKISAIENNKFHIKYNTVKDSYTYSTKSNESKDLENWKEGAFSYSNIQYKVENDWRMCYLARTNGSEKAFIEWGFDLDELKSTDKRLERIEIKCEEACYENGEVKLSLLELSDNNVENVLLEKNRSNQNSMFTVNYVNGWFRVHPQVYNNLYTINSFKLRADLCKGNGNNAWQHTQLFRQSLNDTDKYQFELVFYFR